MFQNEKTDGSEAEHPDSTGNQGKEGYEDVSNWNVTTRRKKLRKNNFSTHYQSSSYTGGWRM